MRESFQLTKIFNDVCLNVAKMQERRYFDVDDAVVKIDEEWKNSYDEFLKGLGYRINKNIIAPETEEFERILEDYILSTMGYHIYKLYKDYKVGIESNFEYFPEVRKYFENAIVNYNYNRPTPIEKWVTEYGEEFHNYIEGYPYVDKLIKAIEKIYCENRYDIVVSQFGRNFMVYHPSDKNEDELPMVCIQDIDRLNKIIEDYIEAIKLTDNFYKNVFDETHALTEDEAIEEILGWTLRNASQEDLSNVELFFIKYLNYVTDNTFDNYKTLKEAGDIFDDKHYIIKRRAALAYETPYYLRFMLKDKRVEFPNIRYGIEWTSGIPVAHIQAIQTSQEKTPNEAYYKISQYIKENLPKCKYFREFNPMHLASLVEFIGMINAFGIKRIVACDYFALRYQRYCLENNKSEEELHNYQHRLTNKYTNTFMRMLEYTDDIHLVKYPDETGEFILEIDDNVSFSSPILQELYDIGYKSAEKEKIGTVDEDIKNRFCEYYQGKIEDRKLQIVIDN